MVVSFLACCTTSCFTDTMSNMSLFYVILTVLFIQFSTSAKTETYKQLLNVIKEQNKTIARQASAITSLEEHMSVVLDQMADMKADMVALKSGRRQAEAYAFTAYIDQEVHLHEGNVLRFDKVLYNLGSLYNPLTGIATLEESGTYFFTLTIEHWYQERREDFRCYLVVDDENMVDVVIPPAGGSSQSSNTAILGLQKGQSVWVESSEGVTYADYWFRGTTFAGVLLFYENENVNVKVERRK